MVASRRINRTSTAEVADVTTTVRGWITWFAGSVAAFTAGLYICGYLAVRSHVNMLGLGGVLEASNDEFLQEGAKFIYMSFTSLALAALSAGVVLGILAALVRGVRTLFLRKASEAISLRVHMLWLRGLRQVLFALVALSFVWTVWSDIDELRGPLCVTNVLYREPDLSQCDEKLKDGAKRLIVGLQSATPLALQKHYIAVLKDVVLHAVFLAGLAAWLAAGWALRRWLLAPFVIAVALMLALLPMEYGVMVRPVRYPRVELTLVGHPSDALGAPLYLLQAGDKAFIVWDASHRSIVWLPASAVLRADVRAIENPLGANMVKGGSS